MNDPADDKLDRLLGDWAAAHQPDEAHLAALRNRVLDEAGAAPAPPAARSPWRARLAWFGLGAAAAAVAAALLLPLLRSHPTEDPGAQEVAEGPVFPPGVLLDPQQLALHARLFAEVQRVFRSDLAWMAESKGKVVLGIESADRRNAAGSEPMTVRLVVMARTPGETSWHCRSSVDVLTYDEEFVQFGPQEGMENTLALWVHRLPDGMIAVDTSLGIERSDRPTLSHSGIQRPAVPEPILTLQTEETEYRVFQTVTSLPKEVGKS